MQPSLGWTVLSRDALRRAEARLYEDTQGVRDEIGFLNLHQAYADRFFPGTSVQQTRLRYVLFVPWIYQDVVSEGSADWIEEAVEEKEIELAGRLKKAREHGIIGGRTFPEPTSQPPSMVYWTALGTWGILRRHGSGLIPCRSAAHRALRASTRHTWSRRTDDDGNLLEHDWDLFVDLPTPPPTWSSQSEPLDFSIPEDEGRFLRRHLISVSRPGAETTPSLLSRLVEQRFSVRGIRRPWAQPILRLADRDDRKALIRAKQIAALSAIGRAVYAALVEEICHAEDRREIGRRHRNHLLIVVQQFRQNALELDLGAVIHDAPTLSANIRAVLQETQSWLGRQREPARLRDLYEQAELRRKGRRARLPNTLQGRERRAEWAAEEHPLAEPLHYRWFNVRRLLNDLGGF
jgi:hypothetical protein